jgi:hypothetical protein
LETQKKEDEAELAAEEKMENTGESSSVVNDVSMLVKPKEKRKLEEEEGPEKKSRV